jgi:hypothetical protein
LRARLAAGLPFRGAVSAASSLHLTRAERDEKLARPAERSLRRVTAWKRLHLVELGTTPTRPGWSRPGGSGEARVVGSAAEVRTPRALVRLNLITILRFARFWHGRAHLSRSSRELVRCGAVLEQAKLFSACRPAVRSLNCATTSRPRLYQWGPEVLAGRLWHSRRSLHPGTRLLPAPSSSSRKEVGINPGWRKPD